MTKPHPRSHEFHLLYANIPLALRRDICCLVGDEPCSWRTVYLEVSNSTEAGYQAIENLIKIDVMPKPKPID